MFALPALGITIAVWHVYLYMVFIVLQSFFGAMLTSPSHARVPVVLVFALSVAACFGAGGYGYAAAVQDRKPGSILRDDLVVKVSVGIDGSFQLESKQIELPLPPLLKFLDRIGAP